MIVLDTNVLSELMRPSPSEAVSRWIADQPFTDLFITAVTQAEILFGLALLPTGHRRAGLENAAQQMLEEDFANRILAFNESAARQFAVIAATRRRLGRPISTLDAQIAAIASAQGASVATRNVVDFEDCGLTIIDPWRF
jgi:predicted nucleic acid-binding protein